MILSLLAFRLTIIDVGGLIPFRPLRLILLQFCTGSCLLPVMYLRYCYSGLGHCAFIYQIHTLNCGLCSHSSEENTLDMNTFLLTEHYSWTFNLAYRMSRCDRH